ncbi:MAG TPA: methyltransferase domain-containing protein [Anaerolineales bacterium]|nr:methyltransferase domain-containing protein [Anaerolineales bacterium]
MTTSDNPIPICDYEGSDYQARFWDAEDRAYEDSAEGMALKRLLPHGGDRLLEVGAGAGRNTLRYHGFREIVLLDYSRTQLEQARARLGSDPMYRYVAADVYRMPFAPDAFDAATMIRTLHHMLEPDAALAGIRHALAPEADFILEFANKLNLKAILRRFLGRQTWSPFDPTPIEFAAMNFNFHPRAVRQWLKMADFQIGRQLAVSYFRLPAVKRWVPLRLLLAMESMAQPSGGLVPLSPSVFLHAKALGLRSRPLAASIWRCPACRSLDVHEGSRSVACRNCGRGWPVRDGMYDFRLDG